MIDNLSKPQLLDLRKSIARKLAKFRKDDPTVDTDEYRTPTWLGSAMAHAAGVSAFELDPFCSAGFSGIPAKRTIVREQNAFELEWDRPASVGFNVPFSIHEQSLARIQEQVPEDAPCIGIVRLDPSTKWWQTYVRGYFDLAAMFHRVRFVDVRGLQTEGSPRSGIAVVARNVNPREFRLHMELADDPTLQERRIPWVVTTRIT